MRSSCVAVALVLALTSCNVDASLLRNKILSRKSGGSSRYFRTDTRDPESLENEALWEQKNNAFRDAQQNAMMAAQAEEVKSTLDLDVDPLEAQGYFPHQRYRAPEHTLPKLTPGPACSSLNSCDTCVKGGVCMWAKEGGCMSDRNPKSHPFGTRNCEEVVSMSEVKQGTASIPRNEKNTELDDYMLFLHGKDSFYYTGVPDKDLHKTTKNTAIATLGYGQDMYTQAKDVNDIATPSVAAGTGTDIIDGAPGGYIDLTSVSSVHGKVGEYNREYSKSSMQPHVAEKDTLVIPMR